MTDTEPGGGPDLLSCPECGTRLAFDQRYCVACGARRRRALVPGLAGLRARLPASRMPRLSRLTESIFAPLSDYLPGWAATPRSAAAAVLGMLGFGVIIGSMVGAGVAGTLRPVEILVSGHPPAGSNSGNVINAGGSGGGGGGSSGGPRTIIQTITNGSGGGGGGGSTTTGQATTSPTTTTPTTSSGIPPIKHVFLIMLSDAGYYQTFASNDAYFGRKLPKAGEVVPFYYGVTQGELANQIAMLSGQGPTKQTASNCPQFTRFAQTGTSQYKEVLGSGCVYPSSVKSLPEQLASGKHGGWRAYIQGLGTAKSVAARRRGAARRRAAAARARRLKTASTTTGTTTTTSTTTSTTTTSTTSSPPPPCAHPSLGASDPHATASQADPYVTWRNPPVYFASNINSQGCQRLDVSLSELAHDLKAKKTTPALSYISPDPCDDGSSQPCHAGAPAGLRPAQKFLQTVIPEIEHSPAYKSGGLIIITSDQAPQSGPSADSSSCCNQPTYPNIPASTTTTGTTTTSTSTTTTGTGTGTTTTGTGTTTTGTGTGTTTTGTTTTGTTTTPITSTGSPGGGQVGMLLISKYVKPGTQDALDYFNHFSLLASLENLFKLPKLGYAKAPGLSVFTATLFNGGSTS